MKPSLRDTSRWVTSDRNSTRTQQHPVDEKLVRPSFLNMMFLEVNKTASCCEKRPLVRIDGLERAFCQANCSAHPKCRFYSYSVRPASCILCTQCELVADAAFSSVGRFLASTTSLRHVAPTMVNAEMLEPFLQGNYSIALYGSPWRVNISTLRIVWLSLLPDAALISLAKMGGACRLNAEPPWQPLYFMHDVVNNPIDALWVHSYRRAEPVPSHGWVEVTHCARRNHISALWLYAAPGSGVSVNVGRTIVVHSVGQAKEMLASLFLERSFSSLPPQCRTAGAGPGSLADDPTVLRQLGLFEDENGAWLDRKTIGFNQTHAALDGIDSLQVVHNVEYYSREPRHEIILLHHSECQPLDDLEDTGTVMCGIEPWLHRCGINSTSLSRLGSCRHSTSAELFSSRVWSVPGLIRRTCPAHGCARYAAGLYQYEYVCPHPPQLGV